MDRRPGRVALLERVCTARLSAYLGRMAPVRANGYRLAIALQGENTVRTHMPLPHWHSAAGFDDVASFPARYALLCRWLASPGEREHRPRTVIAIAVGERSRRWSEDFTSNGVYAACRHPRRQSADVPGGSGLPDLEPPPAGVAAARMKEAPPEGGLGCCTTPPSAMRFVCRKLESIKPCSGARPSKNGFTRPYPSPMPNVQRGPNALLLGARSLTRSAPR